MNSKKQSKKKKVSPVHTKSKQINKRLNTFNSSEFSMLEDKNYASASVCDLFRNDILRNRKQYNTSNSSNRPLKKTAPKPTKIKQIQQVTLKNKKTNTQLKLNQSKSQNQIATTNHRNDLTMYRKINNASMTSNRPVKKKVQKSKNSKHVKHLNLPQKKQVQQSYQHIYLNPSNSQSQIAFSNQDTKRRSSQYQKIYIGENPLIIRCHQEYKVKNNNIGKNSVNKEEMNRNDYNNNLLRISIKKEYEKKVEAVIKIQKVCRGYMTCKLLDKYIESDDTKLMKRLAEIQQIYTNRNLRRNLHFQESDLHHVQSSSGSNLKTFQQAQRSSQFSNRYQPVQFGTTQKPAINNHNLDLLNQQNSKQSNIALDNNDSESEEDMVAYRHQQPIYSHEQISKYLESSEEQEEQDEVYQPQVIFETNEQYIESRKSSLQNKNQPKNDLVNKVNIQDKLKIQQKINEIRNINQVENEVGPHYQQQYHKDQGVKTEHITEQTHEFNGQNQKKFDINLSNKQVIEYSVLKKSREVSNCSSSSLHNKGQSHLEEFKMKKLKEAERQKWQQVIQMISKQVRKNQENNTQMAYFMNSIIQISKRNKQLLNENDQYQRYATPTTMDNKMESIEYEDDQGNTDEVNEPQYKFQKKKNLQIEIIQESQASRQQICMKSKFKDNTNNSFKKEPLRKQLKSPKNQFKPQQQNYSNEEGIEKMENSQSRSISLRDQTSKLRNFLNDNMQNESVESMFKIREQLLQKLQTEMLMKLHNQLSQKQLTQQEFIRRLEQLTQKFQKQKQSIDKARNDIEKGCKAAFGLVKQTYNDAKILGIKIPLSRSLGNLKYKNNNALLFKNVIVDQFECYTPKGNNQAFNIQNLVDPKSIRSNLKSLQSDSGSDLDFTEEELNRFRKVQHYDSQFIQMNKNITISEDFVKKHTNSQNVIKHNPQLLNDERQNQDINIKLSSEAYRQRYEIEDVPIKQNLELDLLADRELDYLLSEFAIQLLLKPVLNEKLIDRSHLSKPKKILKEQQSLFIELLEQFLTNPNELLQKLNQKISPLPFELLKCMRIDFSDQNEDPDAENNQYEEIGKYEFIISQEICAHTLLIFKHKIQQINQSLKTNKLQTVASNLANYPDFQSLNQQYKFDQRIVKFIHQKQKFIKQRKDHTRGLRWQVLNIEVHCIFDAWNQQLIQLRTRKPGYSGVGLNQLTLSTIDQNNPITIEQVMPMIKEGKRILLDILNDESDLVQKIQRQNFEQMCYSDSAWIYYADEALSYGLELGYLVEEEIFSQLVNQIADKFLQRIQIKQNIVFRDSESDEDYFTSNPDAFFI